MKLRNKKTGEIITLKDEGELALLKLIENSLPNGLSLWEEVKEPLIKDEKIRKAVRAWAELVPSAQVRYDTREGRLYTYSDYIMPYSISFPARLGLDEMTGYTIAELCGEEEE